MAERTSDFDLYKRKKGAHFKIKLSNKFEEQYYKKLAIVYNPIEIDKVHDMPMVMPGIPLNFIIRTIELDDIVNYEFDFEDNIDDKVYTKSSGKRVCGFLYNLSPEINYVFYAYAKAKNGKWYKVGDYDRVIPRDDDKLEIKSIEKKYDFEEFIANTTVSMHVKVLNKGEEITSRYFVKVYEDEIKNDNLVDSDKEPHLNYGESAYSTVKIKSHKVGKQKYIFCVVSEDGKILDKSNFEINWDSKDWMLNNLKRMPMFDMYNIDIPDVELPGSFNDYTVVSKNIMDEPINIDFKAGFNSDHSSDLYGLASFNFNNGVFDGVSLGGKSISFNYSDFKKLPYLGEKLVKYCNYRNFGKISFTSGRIDISNSGIDLVGLEIQDSNILPPYAGTCFSRLTISKKSSWKDIEAMLEVASEAVVVGFSIAFIALFVFEGTALVGLGASVIYIINKIINILSNRLSSFI